MVNYNSIVAVDNKITLLNTKDGNFSLLCIIVMFMLQAPVTIRSHFHKKLSPNLLAISVGVNSIVTFFSMLYGHFTSTQQGVNISTQHYIIGTSTKV